MICIYSPKKVGYQYLDNKAHYSLAFDAERLNRVFLMAGKNSKIIPTPDIFTSDIAKKDLYGNTGEDITYFCVSSWDQARFLPGASKSLFYLAWEQTEFYDPPFTSQICLNMLSTLKAYDNVCAIAKFLSRSLTEQRVNSTWFPTPVCNALDHDISECVPLLAWLRRNNIRPYKPYLYYTPNFSAVDIFENLPNDAWDSLTTIVDKKINGCDRTRIFVTLGHMADYRKNLLGVMIGFSLFAADNPDAWLIVKTVPETFQEMYSTIVSSADYFRWGWWGSPNIIILPAALPEEQLFQLYGLADFYLCCPVNEGQNIPLQEAIQNGCYPVTPIHSAMSEYLHPDLVSLIKSEEKYLNPAKYCNAPLSKYMGNCSSFSDIADACQRAVDTDAGQRQESVNILRNSFIKPYTYEFITENVDFMLGEAINEINL